MGRVLTIVAEPPPDGKTYAEEQNQAIQDVLDALPPESKDYTIRRAWSVETLVQELNADLEQFGAPAHLQIVGHGRVGVLLLGSYWNKDFPEGTGYLDSNPYVYGLLDEYVGKDTSVTLIGCEVGLMTSIGGSEVADGPTLLFDLCRMWENTVSAPEDLVNPKSDFEGGLYRHSERLVTARGLQIFPPRSAAPDSVITQKYGVGAQRWRD